MRNYPLSDSEEILTSQEYYRLEFLIDPGEVVIRNLSDRYILRTKNQSYILTK